MLLGDHANLPIGAVDDDGSLCEGLSAFSKDELRTSHIGEIVPDDVSSRMSAFEPVLDARLRLPLRRASRHFPLPPALGINLPVVTGAPKVGSGLTDVFSFDDADDRHRRRRGNCKLKLQYGPRF